MRVVVTGAGGQVGRVVVRLLADGGHEVAAIDPALRGGASGVEMLDADLAVPEQVAGVVSGFDAVVHLAAKRPGSDPPQVLFANNTSAAFGVLTGAAAAGVGRVVVASSGSAYGLSWAPWPVSPDYLPIDEDHPLRPADAYSLSKVVDEAVAATTHRATGLSVVALRFPFVRDIDGVRSQVDRVEAEPGLGARLLWAYIEVEDLARAVEAALLADNIDFEVIGVAAADTLSRRPTAELVSAHHPASTLRAPLEGCVSTWNTARAKRLLGWRPSVSWRMAVGAEERKARP